ncbi:MAG: relaxase/mobilization nuclease domain-containing protein [Roseburia sp.]|nr:relaxase/mobilization nuclease domain-containing protein [Roseburia sp.]
MAIVHVVEPHIHPGTGRGIYAHLRHAIKYILKPEKTLGGLYTASLNCRCETALKEMIETKRQYGKEPDPQSQGYEHDRLGYHIVISWSPKEAVSPETAMEITRQFCEKYLPDYEAVYSAHLDTEHMHTHIVFNSVNYKTGRKYHFPADEWERNIQPLMDQLCKEQGLHTLEEDTGISIAEYAKERQEKKRMKSTGRGRKAHGNYHYQKEGKDGYSMSDYIRDDIDMLIGSSENFAEFEEKLKDLGYEIGYGKSEKYGTYMKLRTYGMKRFRRTHTLGADYTLDMIKRRINAYHKELPPREAQTGEQDTFYLLTGRFYHVRICYKTDNEYLRKQYARLYRLGILSGHRKRPTYRETRERIKSIRKLEYQISLLIEHDYRTKAGIEADMAELQKKVEGLKGELKEQAKDRKPYENMVADYEKLAELEGAYLLAQEGKTVFDEEAKAYERLKEKVSAFPYGKEELEIYLEGCTQKKRDSLRQLREEKKKLEALSELCEEYQKVMEEYAPAEEAELESLEQHGAEREENEQNRNRKRNKGRER